MQRMSLFRQQTHYELLGLSFLVGGSVRKFAVSGSFETLSVFCKVTWRVVTVAKLMIVVQASQEDIRVAYKRLALVQLHLFVQAELGPLCLRYICVTSASNQPCAVSAGVAS